MTESNRFQYFTSLVFVFERTDVIRKEVVFFFQLKNRCAKVLQVVSLSFWQHKYRLMN